jgi:hypothetical protein
MDRQITTAMPELIPSIPPPEKTQAERIAEAIIAESNRHFPQRLDLFKNLWSMLWENDTATPAEILTAWGANAKLMFQAAAAERTWIVTLATALSTTPEALLGDAKYLTPAQPVTFHPDGTVTLQ